MNTGQNWSEWITANSDPKDAHAKREALDDIIVLDLSSKSYAGCYCSSLLAEFGAEVIRIEPPKGILSGPVLPMGCFTRVRAQLFDRGRNKSHITLNLREPEGRELLKGLVSRADILIETFLPGVMDDWGIGYEQLKAINPRLIFASITANGQFGPLSRSRMPDYDNIAQGALGHPGSHRRSHARGIHGGGLPLGRTDQGRPLDRLGANRQPSWPPVSWPHSTGERPTERDKRWTYPLTRPTRNSMTTVRFGIMGRA